MSGRGKSKASLELIDACIKILSEIQPASVRAVCYQLFIRKLIDSMHVNNTNRVGRQLVYAREQCIIDWEWIVDETREVERVQQWSNLARFADAVRQSYRRSRWTDQPRRVEVWSEKGTVRGTLAPVLEQYGVSFRVMHGYSSATAIQDVFLQTKDMEQPLIVLYVGDHDPSGRHMSDVDLPDRLERYYANVELRRVALVPEQCRSLPSFEAIGKKDDPRYQWFIRQHGHTCWELDALSPNLLREAVEDDICDLIDFDLWDLHERVEEAEFESLDKFAEGLAACRTE